MRFENFTINPRKKIENTRVSERNRRGYHGSDKMLQNDLKARILIGINRI